MIPLAKIDPRKELRSQRVKQKRRSKRSKRAGVRFLKSKGLK